MKKTGKIDYTLKRMFFYVLNRTKCQENTYWPICCCFLWAEWPLRTSAAQWSRLSTTPSLVISTNEYPRYDLNLAPQDVTLIRIVTASISSFLARPASWTTRPVWRIPKTSRACPARYTLKSWNHRTTFVKPFLVKIMGRVRFLTARLGLNVLVPLNTAEKHVKVSK